MNQPAKKIALVCRRVVGVSGTTTTIIEHARRLSAEGWDVHVVSQAMDEDRVRAAGATPRRLWVWPWGSRWRRGHFAFRVARLAAREGFDIVHGHGDDLFSDVLSLHNCVHAAHEAVHGAPLPASSAVGRLHERILRGGRFKVLIANSHLMAGDVQKRFGVPSEKIQVIYPGHDPARFRPDDRERLGGPVRARLDVREDSLVVGLITSGDFTKRGVRPFLRALGLLPDSLRKRLRVLVVGKEARWKDYIDDLRAAGMASRLRVLPPAPDVEKLYHALDLYVHPALFEEFGQSVQEALACGVPVLTTPRVGAVELLPEDIRREAMTEPVPEALADALRRLLTDPARRDSLRQAGPPSVRANTWERNWGETRAVYERTASS